MEQPGKNKNGAVASAVFGARWWIGVTSTGADGSDPFWHCLWRDAFAHLRSVAAGRGGAAGSKLTQERTRLVAAKRKPRGVRRRHRGGPSRARRTCSTNYKAGSSTKPCLAD